MNPINNPCRFSPLNSFTCFSCQQTQEKPFAKINRGEIQYVMCNASCLTIALTKLGLIIENEARFSSPVNITVRSTPFASYNSSRSPISKSAGTNTLDIIEEESFSSDSNDIDGLKQIRTLGKQILKKD